MKENVIISLADANYFELLNELVDSIKRFKESKNTAICIMDAGLTDEQKSILSSKVDEIKPADWDIEVPNFKIKGREWLKSQVSRAFYQNIFLTIKNIYGLMQMHGSILGMLLSYILKVVKTKNYQ